MEGDPAENQESIGELLHQLVEEGRTAARAELALAKAVARYRLARARSGAVAVAIALVLGLAALPVLLIMTALWLAVYIGPIGAGLVVSGVAIAIAIVLARWGVARLAVLLGDEEEKRALEAGKQKT